MKKLLLLVPVLILGISVAVVQYQKQQDAQMSDTMIANLEALMIRYIYATFQYVRMPLFTAISGWVYALYPVESKNVAIYLLKKRVEYCCQ